VSRHHLRWLSAVGLAAAAVAGCGAPATEEVTSDAVVSVTAEPAELGDIRGVVHATGVVTPSPGAELIVVAPEAARIAAIPRATGDRVRRGDVLVRFEVPTAVADVQKQQAEVARAQAMLEAAKAGETRAGDLFTRGVAARREVEDAHRAAADATAAVAQAKAALGSAEAVAARATVRATFDGLVVRRLHNPGDLVEAAASDPILRVIDPRRLEIVASVPLADAARVRVGAAAHLAGGPIDAEVALKVTAGPAAVEAGTATVPVRLALAGSPNVPVGAPVEVDIDAEHHQHVVVVPIRAIVREGEETAVFVAAGGKAQRRPVKTGLGDGSRIEILSGVKAGELVVVDWQAGLPDGAAIAAKEAGAAKASEAGPAGGDKAK
jgi:RND family efflux transporter MFP subunit